MERAWALRARDGGRRGGPVRRLDADRFDIDEQRTTPAPHRYIHGGFKGTDAKFSFYFPPREQYQGRFFQNIRNASL